MIHSLSYVVINGCNVAEQNFILAIGRTRNKPCGQKRRPFSTQVRYLTNRSRQDLFSLQMDPRTPIVKVEARLGFNFKRGLSREHRAKKIPQTNSLLKRIDTINQRFVTLDWNDICNSEDVRRAAEDLFNELGPSLWPDFDEVNGPFPKWLLQPGRPDIDKNEHAYLYRRRLFFSSQSDHSMYVPD